jgi:hypothetical protein
MIAPEDRPEGRLAEFVLFPPRLRSSSAGRASALNQFRGIFRACRTCDNSEKRERPALLPPIRCSGALESCAVFDFRNTSMNQTQL